MAKAADEAGVIKKTNQESETTNEPSTGLTCIVCPSAPLTQFSAGVVTDAKPKPAIEPTIVTANGTKTISNGVLPVIHLPNIAAIIPAKTADTG